MPDTFNKDEPQKTVVLKNLPPPSRPAEKTDAVQFSETRRVDAGEQDASDNKTRPLMFRDPHKVGEKLFHHRSQLDWNRVYTMILGTDTNPEINMNPNQLKVNDQDVMNSLMNCSNTFTITGKIASGGYGDIHIALDKGLMRTFALKTLQSDKMERNSIRNSFLTEARVTAYLDHPNIVPVYGIYSDAEGRLNLAMKMVEGTTLKHHIRRAASLYKNIREREIRKFERKLLFERLEIFLKVCDAIGYAHHKKVIHRDLKPENIMVGYFNEVFVMDWGIAEHQSVNNLSRAVGRIAGTISYMAPEIILGKPYDTRSDIYALGLILYEITFLRQAFDSKNEKEMYSMICSGEHHPFTHVSGCRIDSDLKRIIAKAISVSPEDRYQNVRNMADDIRKYLRYDPISISKGFFDAAYDAIMRFFNI